MRVLITGVSGFIGTRLAERLRATGLHVIGTGRNVWNDSHPIAEYRFADLTKAEDCARVLKDVDAVVHCAGKAGAWGPYQDYELANVVVTQELIAACQQAKVTRFINLSSPSIYFDFRGQLDLKEENLPAKFFNAYAATKYKAEQIVSRAHSTDLATVSLRPRGVIGRGDRNWLPRIVAARRANRLVQAGNGLNLVDFTSVENLLDVIETCLAISPDKLGRVYNVSNGEPERFWTVVDLVLQELGLDGKRRRIPLPIAMAVARVSELYYGMRQSTQEPNILPVTVGVAAYSMTLDINAARNHLGYVPRVSTEQAVKEFAVWWQNDASH